MNNIVQRDISPPPSKYQAYLYRYTNLSDDKMYVGIHQGSVDDNYNHSSTSEEFAKVFTDPNSQLKFEVMQYGSFNEMKTAEYNILKKENAKDNEQYYNKHNGAPAFVETDLESIKFLVKQIEDGVFPVTKENISEHEDMPYLQVRFQNNPELQKIIKEKIDDAKGNTDKCNPLIVCEGRTKDGGDIRIDGSHTCFGASQSKHAHEIPVMRIPYDAHANLTDRELKRVANLLNKTSDIIKGPMSIQDAIKDILDNNAQGVPYNSNTNVTYLKECGFTGAGGSGQIKKILDKAKQIIDENLAIKSNKLFIKYGAKPHSDILSARVNKLGSQDGCCSTYMSSAKLSVERILETLYANAEDTNKIWVVIHHPTAEWGKKWKKTIQPLWINILDTVLKDEFEVEFVEMKMWMDDGTKK